MPSAYELATTRAGVIPLSHWSLLEVSGRDRTSFLHNMCTNDIRSLHPGQGCEAFFTDVKGKIVGHGFILAGAESILVLTVPDQTAKLIAHLDRYIIREEVMLADRTNDFAWTLLVGPQARALLELILPGVTETLTTSWSHVERPLDGSVVRWVRCDLPWCGGFLVGAASADGAPLESLLAATSAVVCDREVWQSIRVESGWPLYGVDFSGENLPQEVSRDAYGISFRKGCYLGQEPVARIDALGHVNQQLATVTVGGSEPPPPGAELYLADKPAGRITSACWSPRLQMALGLAMARRLALAAGTTLTCDGQAAEVVTTPAVLA